MISMKMNIRLHFHKIFLAMALIIVLVMPIFVFVQVVQAQTECTPFIYSEWSACSVDAKQTRTVSSSGPETCTGGDPVISQSCKRPPPKITSISPSAINRNEFVEITGENFGASKGSSRVFGPGNREQKTFLDWSDTKIKGTVSNFEDPRNFYLMVERSHESETSPVTSNTFPLKILPWGPPKITQVGPSHIYGSINPPDLEVSLLGENFGMPGSRSASFSNPRVYDIEGLSYRVVTSQHDRIVIVVDSKNWNKTNNATTLYVRVKCLDEDCSGGVDGPDGKDYVSNSFPIAFANDALPFFACTSWTYSDWGPCSVGGQQIRTVINSSPQGCSAGNPLTTQNCTYTPPCTSSDWLCSDWGTCSIGGVQTRTCNVRELGGKTSPPACQGGVAPPPTIQSCVYTLPTCTVNSWSCGGWSSCSSNGSQTRTCNKTMGCAGGVVAPVTTQSCTPPHPECNTDVWTCGAWGVCSLSGIQSRSCTKTFDCPNAQTASPITDQYCEPPSRPTPQTPPSGTDEILNQDSIIKSSVKLLCPVNAQMASQGSGTVIDPSGIILTNKHVIAGTLGCLVGFINDFNNEPYFGERQIADISKVSSNQDIAILKIRNPQNRRLTSIDITKGNSNLRLGTKITIYGYPAKFGTNITYTSGDFSGTDGSYLKTTAILEYGNSGGGAYLSNGMFIGIPTSVRKGELNALGYILSINTINSWLGNSSTAYGGTSNNNYSRVSVLEDIDLNKLDSFKLFIPDTDAKGDLSDSAKNKAIQNSQNIKEQPQTNQIQKESTIIESTNTNPKINPKQNNPAQLESKSVAEEGNGPSIEILEQEISMVAGAVQEIVKVAERNGEIGQQIRAIAQTQTQNQEKLETSKQKIESRSGFAKFFIGPNYGEIKNSQKLLEQSKVQIEELDKLRTQLDDQGDQLQIIKQIQLLEQVNQQLETSLGKAQNAFSLFGWIFRLFAE